MSEWITDRLPTSQDADDDQMVLIPSVKHSDGWELGYFSDLELGDPWSPWPKMPPFKSNEDLARESLPEGYRFVGRGNGKNPLFSEMRFDTIRWDDSKSNWQATTLGTNGIYESAFYAVPEEPEPEYWSCAEDIPPVCWLIVNESDEICRQVIGVDTMLNRVIVHGRKVEFNSLRFARWSDRPFSKFKDGKPCVKGGSDE